MLNLKPWWVYVMAGHVVWLDHRYTVPLAARPAAGDMTRMHPSLHSQASCIGDLIFNCNKNNTGSIYNS